MVNLEKGQNISLEKVAPGLSKMAIGLGWDTNKYDGGSDFDLDVMCFLLGENGKIASGNNLNFVFFNNKQDPAGSVIHTGDNLTGEGEGDDEAINVDLSKIPADVVKIAFVAVIFKAEERAQNFGQITNAYIRVLDQAGNKELIRYDLSEDYSIETGLTVAEIYKKDGAWKFKAIGAGYKKGLEAIVAEYGVQ
jgi:tellurium resistance protein TerD